MAIDSVNGIVNGLGNSAQQAVINKGTITNATAAYWMSMWRATGTPGQGAIPGAAEIPTKATTGALRNFASPTGGAKTYLARLLLMCSISSADFQIHDRIGQMGGLNGTLTTAQTVNLDPSAETARIGASDFADLQWWLEIYTDIGTTQVTATITYTNAAGTTGRTTTAVIGATTNSQNRAGRMIPIIGQGGEAIKSVQSVTLSATTGTAGSFGVTCTRALGGISLGLANTGVIADWAALGFPEVPDNACLFLVCVPGSTSTGSVYGSAKLIQG